MVNLVNCSSNSKEKKEIRDIFSTDSLKFSFIYFESLSEENRKGMSGRKESVKRARDPKLVKGY